VKPVQMELLSELL